MNNGKTKITMEDGSVWKSPHEIWDKAIQLKSPNNPDWKDHFTKATKVHWDNKHVPDKFGHNNPWEKEYGNHAKLGDEVMYVYLRAAIMGITLSQMTDGKSKVIAIGKDKTVEYP